MVAVGTLEVVLIRAEGIKGDEFLGFGLADPYAIITCGRKTVKSNTATDQGSNPVFNQSFTFNLENSTKELGIQLYNENLIGDTHIGSAKVPLFEVLKKGNVPTTRYEVKRSYGRLQGDVLLKLKYAPNAGYDASVVGYDYVNPYAGAPEVRYPDPFQNASSYSGRISTQPSPYTPIGSPSLSPSVSAHYPPASSTQYPPAGSAQVTPSNSFQYPSTGSSYYPPTGSARFSRTDVPQYPPTSSAPYPAATSYYPPTAPAYYQPASPREDGISQTQEYQRHQSQEEQFHPYSNSMRWLQ